MYSYSYNYSYSYSYLLHMRLFKSIIDIEPLVYKVLYSTYMIKVIDYEWSIQQNHFQKKKRQLRELIDTLKLVL